MQAEQLLTEEGQRMWDNLAIAVQPRKPRPVSMKKVVFNAATAELDFLKSEIHKLIINSELVIKDCDAVMANYSTRMEYLASEPKIAKTVHHNFIERLERILVCQTAFEDETHLNLI